MALQLEILFILFEIRIRFPIHDVWFDLWKLWIKKKTVRIILPVKILIEIFLIFFGQIFYIDKFPEFPLQGGIR